MSKADRRREREKGSERDARGASEAALAPVVSGAAGRGWLPAIGVAIVVAIVHAPVISARALAFDDYDYVIRNALVLNPGAASAGRFLSEVLEPSTVPGYYQPLTMISLMLDAGFGGRPDDLRAFHFTSLMLHAANAGLVVLLLNALFGRPLIAAGVGLLFGVHPMTVEVVAWLGERKTVLATFFSLAAMLAYLRYARPRPGGADAAGQTGAVGWMGAAIVLFGLALLSKPTSTPLPVVLLLLDYWPLRRLSWRTVVEKAPLFVLAVGSAVVTVISQGRTAAAVTPDQYDALRIPMIVCHNILFYPLKMVWPFGLTPHYPFPEPLSPGNPMVMAGLIATLLLIVTLVVALRWTRAPMTGWLIFFLAIFPTLGVIGFTNVIASDKYAYLPAIGFLILLAFALGRVCEAARARWSGKGRAAVLVGLLIAAVAASVGTRRQIGHWRDTQALTGHMLALAPLAPEVLTHHAYHLDERGDTAGAIECYRKIIARDPRYPRVQFNLGSALLKQRQVDEAIDALEEAAEQNPADSRAWNNLGTAWLHQRKADRALKCYLKSVELKPDDSESRNNVAVLLLETGQAAAARTHFEEALRLNPGNFRARANLADALARLGQDAEALRQFSEALRQRPDFVQGAVGLADAFVAAGKPEAAAGVLRQALAVNPNQGTLQQKLDEILRRSGGP